MEKKYRINIATALNSKYMRYAYVMLTSLLENQPEEAEVHMFFLHSDLTAEDQKYFDTLLKAYGGAAHCISIDAARFPADCPVSEGWPLEAYYRLLLMEVLPKDVDRILYLDVDIIINHPLDEIYSTDFEGNLLCACEDPGKYPFDDCRDTIFQTQIQNKFRYFNSGVLLINMEMLRKKYSFTDYIATAEKLEYKLLAPDQDLLNYMHWNETKFLDENRYNLFGKSAYNHDVHYDEVKQAVTIVHFAGQKPWEGQYIHYDIEQLWWDYAKMTPFYVKLMEEYIEGANQSSLIYDTMLKLHEEKKTLQEELAKSAALCQKLLQLLQEKTNE